MAMLATVPKRRAEHVDLGEVADAAKALEQRGLGLGHDPEEDGECDDGHADDALTAAERRLGDRRRSRGEETGPQHAQHPRRPSQDDGRQRHSPVVLRCGGGNLADPAAADPHAGYAPREVRDREKHREKPEAGRPEQHRHRLGPHQPDDQRDDRRAAYQDRRDQDLDVRVRRAAGHRRTSVSYRTAGVRVRQRRHRPARKLA